MVKDHRGDCYSNTFEICNAWAWIIGFFQKEEKEDGG